MRVSPRELRGIRAEGLLTRFAILGPVAFVSVELPAGGSAGTGLERPTENAAWGIVLNGSVSVHGPLEQELSRGAAFHIPAGPPPHWFEATGRAVIAGFAPMTRDVDTSDEGIRSLGFEPLTRLPATQPLPSTISPVSGGSTFRGAGSIEVETARMGDWVFSRSTYGPLSGYTSGWCDMAHWGLVLSGDLALRFENSVELLSAGDVYYCPPGPPGHQFQVADGATTVDYTPWADISGSGRKAEWRAAAVRRLVRQQSGRRGARGSVDAPDAADTELPEAESGEARSPEADRSTAVASGRAATGHVLTPRGLPTLQDPGAGAFDPGGRPRPEWPGRVQWVRRALVRSAGGRVG